MRLGEVYRYVKSNGPVARSDIEKALGITRPVLAGLVGALIKNGMIYRHGEGPATVYSTRKYLAKKTYTELKDAPLKLPDYPELYLKWGGWTSIRPKGYYVVRLGEW